MIKVVLHRILVKRDDPEDSDAALTKKEAHRLGIVIPPKVQDALENREAREKASMDTGTVLQIGETAFRDYGIESPVKVGDHITFAKFGGKVVTDPADGQAYVVINDEDVVAILSKETENV